MKLQLATIMATVLVTMLPATAIAQGNSGNAPGRQGLVQATEESADTSESSDEGSSAKRAERLEKYKDKLEARITAAEERRIRNSCKSAQVQTKVLSKNVSQVKKIRGDAYQKISDKLNTLLEKLQLTSVSTDELTVALVELDEQADAFLQAMEDYEMTMTDLSELDCEADPEAFQAALVAAKAQRVSLVSSSQSIRQFVNESIRPILQTIKSELLEDVDSEENTEEQPDNTTTDDSSGIEDEPVEETPETQPTENVTPLPGEEV